jgi:hypothetical protein
VTCDQLVDETTEPARVDRCGIKLPGGVRTEQQTNEHGGELGVVGVSFLTLGQAVEHGRQLRHDLGIEGRQALPELRPAERRHPDLREQDAAVAVGRELDEQEVETANERALRVHHADFGAERLAQGFDDHVDGRDQQIFLRDEVVVHEPGGQVGLGGDALHGGPGDAVLQDRRAQPFDDLAAARSSETRAPHR